VAANTQAINPLYNSSGTRGQNPLFEGKGAGQPIGGIVVKGGYNSIAADAQPANPLYTPSGLDANNPLFQGISTGSTTGSIPVKGSQNARQLSVIAAPGNGKSINEKGIK
jgi:hypothetical protein